MKGRVVLLDSPKDRASAAALLVDGRLEDLLLDPKKGDETPRPDEIYWAKIDRAVPRTGEAFVKLTPKHQGFLRDAKGLREGEGVLVQVVSYPETGKATPVSKRVLYKGRRIIHTPGAPGINVSRQIKDKAERERLVEIIERRVAKTLEDIAAPDPTDDEIEEWIKKAEEEGFSREDVMKGECDRVWIDRAFTTLLGDGGFILRSAANSAPEEELLEEMQRVIAIRVNAEFADTLKDEIGRRAGYSWAFDYSINEWCYPSPSRIEATAAPFRVLHKIEIRDGVPELPVWNSFCSLELHDALRKFDGSDLFDHYGVWDEIERLKSPRVDLKGGAWMSVEPTRAMVAVDVNTGEDFGKGAALKANLAAAAELPRQLRLRGLGGIVTVDFAPASKRERPQIEAAMRRALADDPIQTNLAGWTPLGQLQLQRKRERRPLIELLEEL